MRKNAETNVALSKAIEALSRSINRFDRESHSEVHAGDARMLRECAAVIARCTTDEVLSTLKEMKSVVEV